MYECNILGARPGYFEDEMDGFKKSAKTTRTPPQVSFQTRTRAQSAAEVAAAAAAEVATA